MNTTKKIVLPLAIAGTVLMTATTSCKKDKSVKPGTGNTTAATKSDAELKDAYEIANVRFQAIGGVNYDPKTPPIGVSKVTKAKITQLYNEFKQEYDKNGEKKEIKAKAQALITELGKIDENTQIKTADKNAFKAGKEFKIGESDITSLELPTLQNAVATVNEGFTQKEIDQIIAEYNQAYDMYVKRKN